MQTHDSHGTGTPPICHKSRPDGQIKAEQMLSPRKRPFRKESQEKQLHATGKKKWLVHLCKKKSLQKMHVCACARVCVCVCVCVCVSVCGPCAAPLVCVMEDGKGKCVEDRE
jgi:hypothetical protein